VAALPTVAARAAAKYTRYSVTSPEGQKMLASYAKGVEAMLKLPPEHPQNWFRNAFVHLMDCPHGNWWFYVWHRGFVGYFEQTIRKLSGDDSFAIPFWDWSELPKIPNGMFDGVLDPTAKAFAPFTRDLASFTRFIQPVMQKYWSSLSADQRAEQAQRGVNSFADLWDGVTGGSDPTQAAFAVTEKARYLTRDNPALDDGTAFDCSRQIVLGGLGPTYFYASDAPPKYLQALTFNSVKTASHTVQPDGTTWFSILEGLPHNNVHNNIGGVPVWNPGPYGNMTNFLSPVDPIFFLHHSNMDRLWDVWTRKQQALKLNWRPNAKDAPGFMNEPFRFFVDSDGKYVTNGRAGDYFNKDVFGYDYAPGTGDELIPATPATSALIASVAPVAANGSVHGNIGTVALPKLAAQARLVVAVTVQRPAAGMGRSFDVLVNAPQGVTRVRADSPYFAGRVAFFGPAMHHMHGGNNEATFLVPLLRHESKLKALGQLANVGTKLNISVAPSSGSGPATGLKAVSIMAL
jgi:tyrosinase